MQSSIRRRRWVRSIVLATAVAGVASVTDARPNGTWAADVGLGGGNWSVPTNWSLGNIPNGPADTASFITLPTFTTAPVTIFQDSPNVTLAGMTYDSFITYLVRSPAASPGNSITLTGAATINTVRPSINTLSITFFGHQMQIPIAGTNGLTKTGPGTLRLNATNTFSGAVNVNAGILVASTGDGAFGNAGNQINLSDGTIRITTSGWTSSRTINLTGQATIESGTVAGITFNGPVNGTGSLNKIGSNGLIMTTSNSYSGATNLMAGTMTLNGNGALSSTASVMLRNTLTLDNAVSNVANRLNDAAPLTSFGAGLAFIGMGSADSSETVGNFTFSRGTSTITVTPGASGSAVLAMGTVGRNNGGAAFFRGTNLGNLVGSDVANITMTNGASQLIGGIIPWAFGNTSAAAAATATSNSFVTYGPHGVRPLNTATEYENDLTTSTPASNVRITTSQIINGSSNANALILATAGITGSGAVNITTGALLNLQANNSVSTSMNFGPAEAMIMAPANITFSGPISGNGGLTKQGAGIATFASANSTYAGSTTIGGGTAIFLSNVSLAVPSPFGMDSSAIVLAPAGLGTGGTTARLVYGGTGTGFFNRNLNVTGRIALNNAATVPGFGAAAGSSLDMNGDITLDASPLTFVGGAGTTITVNGQISGSGMLTDNASGAANIVLNGNNTFTGGGEMQSATWQLGSNTALGTGMFKMVQTSGQPTLMAVGGPRTIGNEFVSFAAGANYWQISGSQPLTFTGDINLSGSYTHNINNSALTTYAGMVHTGGFTKAGSGVLLLSGNNTYSGTTTVTAGVLRISHANALGTPQAQTIVNSGAALEITGNALSSEPVTINGVGGPLTTGALRSTSGNNSLGPVTLSGNSTIMVDSGQLTVGAISASPPSLLANEALLKDGPGDLNVVNVRVGDLEIRQGALNVIPGPVIAGAGGISTVGALRIGGGPSNPTAKLELSNNAMIAASVPDDGPEVSDVTARQYIQNGYNNGIWGGNGITSSTADFGANQFGIGYATAGSLGLSSFLMLPVLPTDTLFRLTRYGDANLDGVVNLNDFNRLAAGFGIGNVWAQGDFNYDGVVNLNDFNRFATNFGLSASPGGPTAQDWAALAAVVPEPSSALIIGVAASAALFRPRRRRVKYFPGVTAFPLHHPSRKAREFGFSPPPRGWDGATFSPLPLREG